MNEKERPKERKLKVKEAIDVMPQTPQGVKIIFKKKQKKDKLKTLLGPKLKGISIRQDEITIIVDVDDLSISEKEKIQKIVDGE